VNKDDRQLQELGLPQGACGRLRIRGYSQGSRPLRVIGHEVAAKQQVRALIGSRPNFDGKHEAHR
jgi:hypothetical protein